MLPLIWSYCSSACCNQFSNNALFVSNTEVESLWFLLLEDLYPGKPTVPLCTCRWSVKYSHLVILVFLWLYLLFCFGFCFLEKKITNPTTQNKQPTAGYCLSSRTNRAQFCLDLCPLSLSCSNPGITSLYRMASFPPSFSPAISFPLLPLLHFFRPFTLSLFFPVSPLHLHGLSPLDKLQLPWSRTYVN